MLGGVITCIAIFSSLPGVVQYSYYNMIWTKQPLQCVWAVGSKVCVDFRYKGLLNCAGEHRGELCWESADVRAERPRPLLLLFIVVVIFLCRNGPPKKRTPKSKIQSRIISLGGISLPREPILDSVIVWACSACSACSA